MPRTNNNIEGWHRKFECNLTVAHPGFWKFLNALKREENLSRVDILQADGGHQPPAQRRRYVDLTQDSLLSWMTIQIGIE